MILKCEILVGALLAMLGSHALAQQMPANDFYRGKTLTVIVPTSPGGGRAANTAPLIQFIAHHIPGNPTVVPVYMPGAGGAVGMNYLYNAAPHDGTVIGTPLAAFINAQVTAQKSIRYDASKMKWIGRTTDAAEVLYVWHTSKVESVKDATTRVVTVGSDGVSSASTIIPRTMNEVFKTQFKVIQGYEGSAAYNLAVQRGEIDGAVTTWDNIRNGHGDWLRDHLLKILFQVSSSPGPGLEKIPLAVNLAQNAADRSLLTLMSSSADLGESFVAPPGVPTSIVETLRQAFEATMKDPAYIATTTKLGIILNPLTGEQLTAIVQKTLATPPAVVDRYQQATAKD
jgi:tripartite-type tricarboxylate transporter receptor subunit TctC